jgi:3alpha(or 20beta)-hydroxysteroid dehydrogenase
VGQLDGKTAIVSGGAGGMGSTDVRSLAAEGARVVLGDIDEATGMSIQDEFGGNVRFCRLNVCDGEQWRKCVEFAETTFGPVDVLVNNAGIVRRGDVQTMDEGTFRQIMDINVVGVFLGMQAVAPSMIRAGGGTIVNLSSIGGMIGGRSSIAYTASKWAVRGMSKGAALQLGEYGIRVHSIHPGFIDTPMGQSMWVSAMAPPIGRFGEAADIARLIVFLASDAASYMTGTEQVIDGGLLAGSLQMEVALGNVKV